MTNNVAAKPHLNWKLPLSVAGCGGVVLASLIGWSPYGYFLYILLIAPIVCLVFLVLLLFAAVRKRQRQCLSLVLTLVAFLAVSGAMVMNKDVLRDSFRWLFWSHRFKAELLAQSAPKDGELRHMEWEATGFAGVANETAYLVFDPSDSLSAAGNGKSGGLPCEVLRIHRLEGQWYSVWFYTDEAWGQRNRLDCTGVGQ